MARPGTIRVKVSVHGVADAVRDLHRIRYPFLTPIGRNVPPRGTLARAALEAGVGRRRAVRALLAAFGVRHRVDFAPTWRRLELFAIIYVAWMVGIMAILWLTQPH